MTDYFNIPKRNNRLGRPYSKQRNKQDFYADVLASLSADYLDIF